MKRHLFYLFLWMFGVTYAITLLGLIGVLHIEPGYLPGLFTAFISETAVAVIALFRGTNFFTDDDPGHESKDAHGKEIADTTTANAQAIAALKADNAKSEAEILEVAQDEINKLNAANRQLVSENAAVVKKNTSLVEANLTLKETLHCLQSVVSFRHKIGVVFKRSKETGGEWRAFCPDCGGVVADVDLGRHDARACCQNYPPCGHCFDFQEARSLAACISQIPATIH
jgi:Zn finger protein HypA/HybF involved in hydrogenase expression